MRALFALGLFLGASALAEDITTTDGKVYKDATIVKHDAATATILYSNGGATIEISKLDPALQKELGYNPTKAAAFRNEQTREAANEQRARARDKIKEQAIWIDGYVTFKDKDGTLFIDCQPPSAQAHADGLDDATTGINFARKNQETADAVQKQQEMHGKPIYGSLYLLGADSDLAQGDRVRVTAYPAGQRNGPYGIFHAYTVVLP